MNLSIFETNEQLSETAASIITGLVQLNPQAVLGMATGGTQVDVYRCVVEMYLRGLVSFRNVTTFNLDEYVGIPVHHPQSYHSYMKDHLFDHIDIANERTHLPNGSAADVNEECRRFDGLIEETGGIDLQLLGLGHNGHIGFNEPALELSPGTHVVDLAEETMKANARYFSSVDQVPKQALTMGMGTIFKADTVLLVVKGADKADIVWRALKGPVTTSCPASLLQMHPRLIVLLNREAAKHIE
jgi:glucosamine-6-phosphate deaminase